MPKTFTAFERWWDSEGCYLDETEFGLARKAWDAAIERVSVAVEQSASIEIDTFIHASMMETAEGIRRYKSNGDHREGPSASTELPPP